MLKKLLISVFVSELFLTSFSFAEEDSYLLGNITVFSGDHLRVDTPVCVKLPPQINAFRNMRLVEVKGKKSIGIPFQVEPGNPPKLWWLLNGKTPKETKRTFKLFRGVPVQIPGIVMELNSKNMVVSFKGQEIFAYNHAHVIPPKGVAPQYIRSGYIFPVLSPSGMLIAEDFPKDHRHHKGIWSPWTSTEYEGHHIDFWNLGGKTGTVQFAGFEGIEDGPVYGRLKAKHEFVDLTQPNGGKIILNETWDIRIWAVGGPEAGYWIWDITSIQECVAKHPLHLNNYRYGGLGYRGPKEWKGDNYVVLTSKGDTKKNGHTKRSKWCANSGSINGKWATLVMMCNPKNERFKDGGEPMRIWPSGGCFFNYVPIQKKPMDLNPGEKHTFSYRFFIHEGRIDKERAERVWEDFAEMPEAELNLAK